MPWTWPVDVNYIEAKAFCNWKSQSTKKYTRLITEDEWYILTREYLNDKSTINSIYNDNNTKILNEKSTIPCNNNLQYFLSSCPVNLFENTSKNYGSIYDIQGNVWQHTDTVLQPYENFIVHPVYDDFTVPTFDDNHNVIKGGSFISTGNEITFSSRYAFRRHFYQHAGFRYVQPNIDDSEIINEQYNAKYIDTN